MSLLSTLFGNRTVLCDGAMGTALYGRGVFLNKCFDELNLTQPELVRSVHEEYLQAGAEIIETNTFGANSFRLHRFGLQDQSRAINQAGARLAREAVAQLADKQAGSAFVAGSVGPLGIHLEPLGKIALEEARDAFADQIEGLVAGGPGVGVDLLAIETMMAINESEQAIYAAKQVAPEIPVLAMVTVDEDSNCLDGTPADVAAARLTAAGADAIGCNCSTGPEYFCISMAFIHSPKSSTRKPSASASKCSPASINATLRVVRLRSRTPSRSSKERTIPLMLGREMPSCVAALVKLRCSATATKALSSAN